MAQALPPGLPLLRSALGMLTDALRPQRLQDAADREHRDRGLTLTPHTDRPGGHLCGDLDAECFELVHTALTACADADPDNPRDTEGWAAARAAGWEIGDPIPAGLYTTGSACTTSGRPGSGSTTRCAWPPRRCWTAGRSGCVARPRRTSASPSR